MKIDWFDFWLIFSGILFFFLLINIIIKFFHWLKFKKELSYIKQEKIQSIVKKDKKTDLVMDKYTVDLLDFKKEMDFLMKDVCFDLYDRHKSGIGETMHSDFKFDFEESLEKLLDGKILDVIKEKDHLLTQKDSVISSLQEKNQKILKEIVNKMFFLILEKDKLLREKDAMIDHLKNKIQNEALVKFVHEQQNPTHKPTNQEPQAKHPVHSDFLNVNSVGQK